MLWAVNVPRVNVEHDGPLDTPAVPIVGQTREQLLIVLNILGPFPIP